MHLLMSSICICWGNTDIGVLLFSRIKSYTKEVKMDEIPHLLTQRKDLLPPILCERDKSLLNNILNEIEEEIVRLGCPLKGPDEHRYWIYSSAFNKLINNVTVYKDVLADIKREYEDCITAITNGQREAVFLRAKLKSITSLPTTIAGYKRRSRELQEKLEILNQDNQKLEMKLKKLLKSEMDNELVESDENESTLENDESKEYEMRPIPGMTVAEWTNEELLKQAIEKMKNRIEDIKIQRKNAYVPKVQKLDAEKYFQERLKDKEILIEQKLELRKKISRAKHAVEILRRMNQNKQTNIKSDDIISRIKDAVTKEETEPKSPRKNTPKHFYDEDDPTQDKEADLILEYIDKFNEFFNEKEYFKAAQHAANSPKGVLRAMETLVRFKKISEGWEKSPSPLLYYAEAMIQASAAQSHVVDADLAAECVCCALNENRFDMVTEWLTHRSLTLSKRIGDTLVEYGEQNKHHWQSALIAAQSVYGELPSCNIENASLLHKLGRNMSLLDFTFVSQFTMNDYLELLSHNASPELVWLLSQTNLKHAALNSNLTTDNKSDYVSPLPIPVRVLLHSLIKNENYTHVIVELLLQIQDEMRNFGIAAGMEVSDDHTQVARLHDIVYVDGDDFENNEQIRDMWMDICNVCDQNDHGDISLEIQASLITKETMFKALLIIAQDEKEQFDYYT